MRVLIAGAGIGGLTAGLILKARGHDPLIYEVAPEIRALGVGINLLPHSVRVLSNLGLEDELLRRGVATRELVYFNKHGQRIWNEARGRAAGYEWPQISLGRRQLLQVLLDTARARLGSSNLQTGHRLVAFDHDARGVTAQFAVHGGTRSVTAKADALVAADGIHSAARQALFPREGPPIYAGRTLWRATTRAAPFLTGASMIMAGYQDQKFVAYPITELGTDHCQTINWIAELKRDRMPEREDWNRNSAAADFLPAFVDWRFDWLDIPALIGGAAAVYEFPLIDRDPLAAWSFGRVTLLGDAAHPMYPIGSNGASQAILDAEALGRAIDEHADPEDAFRAYEDARLAPTAAIVFANRRNGPEQCMQIVEERAPNGFTQIEDVISADELAAIACGYKYVAGFGL